MSEHEPSSARPAAAEVWMRFMAAALAGAPHAPAEKLAATADEALAEYQRRAAGGHFGPGGQQESNDVSGATATPFVAQADGDRITYEPTADAPSDEEIDSPFRPPNE